MEHIAGPVDDGLEQLVPGSCGRRQAGDLVQEAQLLELVSGALRARRGRARNPSCGRAGTRIRRSSRSSRYKPTEWLRRGRLRAGRDSDAERASPDAPPEPFGGVRRGRRGAARDRDRGCARPARGRGPAARSRSSARSSRSRPGRTCSRWSNGSGSGRSPSAATTTRSSGPGSTRSCARSTSTPRRPSSVPSRSISGWSTWPRRAAGCGRLRRRERAARDGVLDDSVADAVAGLRRLGRTDERARRAHRRGSRSARS